MWEQVCLLVLADLVGQGGLGLWGDWGPLKFSPQHLVFPWERYLSIQSMLGKKENKYQHFNIFDYTYLPKTDICLFFFLLLFFSMNLSLRQMSHCKL